MVVVWLRPYVLVPWVSLINTQPRTRGPLPRIIQSGISPDRTGRRKELRAIVAGRGSKHPEKDVRRLQQTLRAIIWRPGASERLRHGWSQNHMHTENKIASIRRPSRSSARPEHLKIVCGLLVKRRFPDARSRLWHPARRRKRKTSTSTVFRPFMHDDTAG